MSKRYSKGRRFEYRVKEILEKQGYIVFRMAGSRPCDLIALKADSECLLIECKSTRQPDLEQLEKLRKLAEETGCRLMVAVRKNKKIEIKEVS